MDLNKLLVHELARCEYILRRESIIALGSSGTARRRLALGLAVRQRGLAGCLHDRGFARPSVIEGRDEIRASWTVESGPAVMKKATSKTSTTPRASRLCARPGDKLERMKCCSSGTTAAVFTIGATPRSSWNGDEEFLDMASSPVAILGRA